jgi:hypothetical protein
MRWLPIGEEHQNVAAEFLEFFRNKPELLQADPFGGARWLDLILHSRE